MKIGFNFLLPVCSPSSSFRWNKHWNYARSRLYFTQSELFDPVLQVVTQLGTNGFLPHKLRYTYNWLRALHLVVNQEMERTKREHAGSEPTTSLLWDRRSTLCHILGLKKQNSKTQSYFWDHRDLSIHKERVLCKIFLVPFMYWPKYKLTFD